MKPTVAIILLGVLTAPAPAKRSEWRACVRPSLVAAPVVRDDGRVYFRGEPDPRRSYLAVFKGACPGLNRFSAVQIERMATGYCEGDRVRVLHPPTRLPGTLCVIDHLEPFAGDVDD